MKIISKYDFYELIKSDNGTHLLVSAPIDSSVVLLIPSEELPDKYNMSIIKYCDEKHKIFLFTQNGWEITDMTSSLNFVDAIEKITGENTVIGAYYKDIMELYNLDRNFC